MRQAIRSITVQLVAARRGFATSRPSLARNRIYPTSVRNEDELHTLIMMSSSTRVPLITLWTTNWCASCKMVSPLIRQLIEKERVGEAEGSVSYVEVEMDSPDLGGVGGVSLKYGITSIPTLLAFDRNEPQLETKAHRLDDLKNKEFLTEWIKTEAKRHGEGGAGGRFMSFFGR